LIRSIWLALFFLVAIGALAAFKVARPPLSSRQAFIATDSVADAAGVQADPAEKTNRLNVANADSGLERKSIQSIAITPQLTTVTLKEETAPAATSRWRQRYARMSGRHRHHHHRHARAA
jgi:hypothetical protein